VSAVRTRDDFIDPEILWWPSVAPGGITFYTGDHFPAWRGNLFVGTMVEGRIPGTGHLERIVFNTQGQEIRRERLLTELGHRIRDVQQGPDGYLYLLTDEEDGALLRLEPVEEPAAAQSAAPGSQVANVSIEQFLGAWDLVRWTSTNAAGETTYPYGENAMGRITYTASGRMSAHLMRPPENPSDPPPQHLAYWGTFTLDAAAGTVTHHVMGADRADWIGSDQVRQFRFEGEDRLVLSLGPQDLVWQRTR
jgi:hypothetical protein